MDRFKRRSKDITENALDVYKKVFSNIGFKSGLDASCGGAKLRPFLEVYIVEYFGIKLLISNINMGLWNFKK